MSYRGFRGGGGGRRPYGGGPRGRGRGRGGGPYSWNRQENNNERQGGPNPRIIDDDEVMGNDTPTGRPTAPRYTPYGGKLRPRGGRAAMDSAAAGGSSVLSRLGTVPAKSPAGSGDVWYKVLIPHGKKCDKKYLLESLTQHAGPFITENFHFEGNNAIFLVNGRETANALRAASGKFRAPNGFKVTVITTPAPINSGSGGGWNKSNPRIGVVELAPNVVEKLKLCLAKRYDAVSKSLNLSNLFHDEDMTKDDIHLSLGRREVASNVLTIAKENIPQLEILDLSSNRLMSLENLAKLAESLPNITRLNLKNNTLKSTDDLNHLQPLKLEELWLEGNPLCDRFNTDTAYTSVLRKLFPRLKTLDGHELPAAITFEIDTLSSLPPTKGNYFANEQVQNLLVRFLNQYFTLYDADNREKLFEAYHENAVLSMNVGYNQVLSRQTNFEDYIKENRNLLKAPVHKKDENLKKGRLLVVAFLTKLPLTTHDPNAFTLDVVHVSAASLIFTVYGVFKERQLTKETNKLRTFSRTFVTVPQGDGIVIANEFYHITNASPEQQESAFKQAPAPTPSSSPAPVTGVSVEVQLQMVRQFAIDSTMNEDWSRRCLEQNVWDYQKAAACFADLQAKGAIPAEAFQK